jgi:bacteriocin biosynthesis cyclodehydratase domain-containing protein
MGLALTRGDIWDISPKLRHDVVFSRAPTGAHLRDADAAIVIKGRTAFDWLTALIPYLDGRHPVREICAGLDHDQQQTALSVLRALLSRGFAKEGGHSTQIDDRLVRRFASQVEFIDHFADDGTGRFLRFHTAAVTLSGRGDTLRAAVAGLLRNGCAQLDVYPEDDPAGYRDLCLEADESRSDGVPVDLRIHADPGDGTRHADAIIYCGDASTLGRLRELATRCHADGPLLLPVFWHGGRAVVGPTAGLGQAPCWLCTQLRITAGADPANTGFWRDLPVGATGRDSALVDETAARMIGNAAAFELFRALTGACEPETASSVVILDLATLESFRERVLPHPACPICRKTPVLDVAAGPTSTAATDEEVYNRASVLVSDHAGVFSRFVDDALEQAPLKTARLVVPTDGGRREITAFDVHTVMNARLNAYRVAVQQYVAALPRPDDGVVATYAELVAAGREPVPWRELVIGSGVPFHAESRLRWLPARVLGGAETVVWVPAAAALPCSPENVLGLAERTMAGSAAGASLDEVVERGLASAIGHAALVAAIRGDGGLTEISEEALTADADTTFVIKGARRLGYRPRAFALSGAHPIPAVVAVASVVGVGPDTDYGPPVWTFACGFSAIGTRLAALRDLVGRLQTRQFERADADLGDPPLAGFDPDVVLSAARDTAVGPTPDTNLDDVISILGRRGQRALLVETTTRDLTVTGAFRTGSILLWHAAP